MSGISKKQRESNKREKKILEYSIKKIPVKDIVKMVDISEKGIYKVLDKYKDIFKAIDDVDSYEKNKSTFLSSAEFEILKTMVQPDKLDKATVNQSAYAYQVLHTANRLEKGQSTANVATFSRVVSDDDLTPKN